MRKKIVINPIKIKIILIFAALKARTDGCVGSTSQCEVAGAHCLRRTLHIALTATGFDSPSCRITSKK